MNLQDAFAASDIGTGNHNPAIKPTGPQQRRIEDIGPVRGGDHDHAIVRLEAVHLDQELIQGLLPLIVSTA